MWDVKWRNRNNYLMLICHECLFGVIGVASDNIKCLILFVCLCLSRVVCASYSLRMWEVISM